MQYVITGGPDGDVRYYWVLENGKLLESKLGELPDAEVTLTQTYEDAMRIQKGELDANAAFMQGRIKVTGNMAKLLALLPITNSRRVQAAADRDPGDHRVLSAAVVGFFGFLRRERPRGTTNFRSKLAYETVTAPT